eukprot:Gb_14664 [translate_table: standard]
MGLLGPLDVSIQFCGKTLSRMIAIHSLTCVHLINFTVFGLYLECKINRTDTI